MGVRGRGWVVQRNHLGIDNPLLHPPHHCLSGTKYLIERYQHKLTHCLHVIAETKTLTKVGEPQPGVVGGGGAQ